MGRGGAGLIAAVLILAGCKSTDPKPADKDAAGTTASRTKGSDGKIPSWLDAPGDKSSAGDPGVAREAAGQKFVSGRVLDPFNRPVPKVFIQVEAANAAPGLPPVGIYTDESGAFSTNILSVGKSYNLTVDTTLEGKRYLGMVQTLVPKQGITIALRDDLVPPGGNLRGPTTGGFAPPDLGNDRIPPPNLNGPMPRPSDGAWSPGFDATKQLPSAIAPTTAKPATVPAGSMPPPDDVSAPIRPAARPENVADGNKNPWAAPPVSIPGAPIFPPSLPNPVPPPPAPPPPGAMEAPAGNGFILLDNLSRNWVFPASKSGGLVLLEFMTTDLSPSVDVAPVMRDLQARYASAGLQVVAVACNERLTEKQRLEAASNFARDRDVNYQVMIEPGDVSGIVRNRYNIREYPTAVLLDASGVVLWQGHPNRRTDHEHRDLEIAIQKAIRK